MKFIERLKYSYSMENIKYCFREYPRLATCAIVGDLCIVALIVGAILWGTGVIG